MGFSQRKQKAAAVVCPTAVGPLTATGGNQDSTGRTGRLSAFGDDGWRCMQCEVEFLLCTQGSRYSRESRLISLGFALKGLTNRRHSCPAWVVAVKTCYRRQGRAGVTCYKAGELEEDKLTSFFLLFFAFAW